MNTNYIYNLNDMDMQIIEQIQKPKKTYIFRYQKAKNKQGNKALTENIANDIIENNPAYQKKTLKEEQYIIKILRLSFYPDASKEEKEMYLTDFCQVQPWLLEKLQSDISQQEKNKAFNQALQIAEETKEYFIAENSRLVMNVAKKYINYGIPYADLIQEGTFGIVTAIQRFDLTRNNKFSGYAICWIKQTLNRYIKKHARLIRLPEHVITLITHLNRLELDLTKQLNRMPTEQELADNLQLSVEKLRELKGYHEKTISLDFPIFDEEDTLNDFILDPNAETEFEQIDNNLIMAIVKEAVESSKLKEREKYILYSYYGFNGECVSDKQLGQELGVTRERIYQIRTKSLKKLKKSSKLLKLAIDSNIVESQ